MCKKLASQMREDEINYLNCKVGNIKQIKIVNHCKDRMFEKGITEKDIQRCLKHGEIVEFHFRESYNSCRVLLRDKMVIRGRQVCISVELGTGAIVTCYFNHVRDLHITLDENNYNKNVDIHKLCSLYLN